MSDDERNNHRDAANAGGASSDENMDLDIEDMMMIDSDDDVEFHDARIEVPPGPFPVRAGPHRAQSIGRVAYQPPAEYLYNVRSGRFVQSYRVMSTRILEARGHANLESGGKVILPPDALEQLSRNSSALMRPMMFKATNQANQKSTHCGVLEFIAEERTCYMPSWMMSFLGAVDLNMIQFERVELPTATFVKFQPQSVDFLEISDQRAVLENSLRHFACLTVGDLIAIHYNNRMYQLSVLELLPRDAVTIIECDMNVDFAAPVGYVSPSESDAEDDEEGPGTSAFFGTGNRLNGRNEGVEPSSAGGNTGKVGKPKGTSGAPDSDWKIGNLQFKRKFRRSGNKEAVEGQGTKKVTPFVGIGLSLRSAKKSSASKKNDDL